MKMKEYAIVPLFEQFIKESLNGKRLKKDGTLLKQASIRNYKYVLGYLIAFQNEKRCVIRLKSFRGVNSRLFIQEKKILGRFLLAVQQIPF